MGSIDNLKWAMIQLEDEALQIRFNQILAISMLRHFLLHILSFYEGESSSTEISLEDQDPRTLAVIAEILKNELAVNFMVRTSVRKYGFQALLKLMSTRVPFGRRLQEVFPDQIVSIL